MDTTKFVAELVLDKENGVISDILPIQLSDKLLFTKQRGIDFYMINSDGSDLETIHFTME